MPIITVQQFKTTTEKSKTIFSGSTSRGSMAKIDAALENYHQKIGMAVTPGDQVELLYSLFQACIHWLKKKESRSEFTTNMIGMKTNYYDQNFLARRNEVKNLGNSVLDAIFQILIAHGVVGPDQGLIQFDRSKLQMLTTRKTDRPALKPMEDSYKNERVTYLKSDKQQGVSGSSVHSFHAFANRMNDIGTPIPSKARAALRKDVDSLTMQDWIVLDALSRHPEVNQGGDLIYKKKMDRLEMMLTPDAQGKLLNAEGALFSTRALQPGIFAMDRYGNLFIEPATLNVGNDFFNHSSFNAGHDVICAGEMTVDQGVIRSINNGSGHYKPTRANLHECVNMLQKQTVDLAQAQVSLVGANPPVNISATTFLANG